MAESLIVVAMLLCFGIAHSLQASGAAKQWAFERWGESFVRSWYRFLYSAVSVMLTGLLLVLLDLVPDRTLLVLPGPLRIALRALQVLSLVFVAASFRVFSAAEFLGLSQLGKHLARRPVGGDIEGLREGPIERRGVYGILRHPMYAGGIAFFLFSPGYSRTWVIVRLLAIAYMVYGALIEERRLTARYGEEYRRIVRKVPRFLPRLRPRR